MLQQEMLRQETTRLQLDPEAKRVLDQLCVRRDMTQIAVLSRLVTWFGRQDAVLQASVLGHLSDGMIGALAGKVLAGRGAPPARRP